MTEMLNTVPPEAMPVLRAVRSLSLRLKYAKPRDASWTNVFTFAESCTGGLIASWLTSLPGISAVFPGSAVTYSNEAKIEQLSVAPETIGRYGAVSARCAAEMARGALRKFGTMMAVSVTGIAGPDGGSPDKPVGTVWFAIAHEDGRMKLRRGFYPKRSRAGVQRRAARAALEMLLNGIIYMEAKM
ncbi:MAG: CinA family protein [Synergistaceae bacterium]|jgi:PncC family amidohydrolase|nr:CinA family protein [Synergistaceae bacterium]